LESPRVRATAAPAVLDLGDEALPELGALERPEELLRRPPYFVVVRYNGNDHVDVQSSHQGTLMLLESYLTKWVRHSTTQANRVSRTSRLVSWKDVLPRLCPVLRGSARAE